MFSGPPQEFVAENIAAFDLNAMDGVVEAPLCTPVLVASFLFVVPIMF